jgi:serine/threonine protein phosphatase PrpC
MFRSASVTDTGRVRMVNQDVALANDRLVAVADGMGGHAAGDIAARLAIEALDHTVEPHGGADSLIAAVRLANRSVFEEAEAHAEMRGMGTTLTAAAIIDSGDTERICLINVGDSRAYLLEHGEMVRLTDDHSLVEQLVRQGELTAEEAVVHPHRHILTRALGIDLDLEVDSWILEPRSGMRFLLCTDGLTNECTEEEIAVVLRDFEHPEDAAGDLVERALAHGGNDNITAVVVDLNLDETVALTPPVDDNPLPEKAPPTIRGRRPAPLHAQETAGPEPIASRTRATAEASTRGPGRIVTGRVVLFVIALIAILGGIAGITVWFDRATYFVGISRGNIAIFEGRPDGMLWFHPTLVARTSTPISSVIEANLPLLRAGILESSYDDAATTARNLAQEKSLLGLGLPQPTTTTTNAPPAATSTTSAATTPTTLKKK